MVVVLAVWELIGRGAPLFLSYPSAILSAGIENFVPKVLPAFAETLAALTVGLAIAIPSGLVIGIAMGWLPIIEVVLLPYMNALYATPRISLIPLLILWLGIDFQLRVTIVVLSAVFPIAINAYAGTRETDEELLDVGRSFMATRSQQLRTIVIPGSLPFMFTGLRIGLARGMSGIVVAEMTAALAGIGRLILNDARFLRTDEMFVPIILLGLLSIALTAAILAAQRLATPWARAAREP